MRGSFECRAVDGTISNSLSCLSIIVSGVVSVALEETRRGRVLKNLRFGGDSERNIFLIRSFVAKLRIRIAHLLHNPPLVCDVISAA